MERISHPWHRGCLTAATGNRVGRCAVMLMLAFVLGGCQGGSSSAMAGAYYRNKNKNLSEVGRVALVELDNQSSYPQVTRDVTEAIHVAFQKRQRFGITVVEEGDPSWRGMQLGTDLTYEPSVRAQIHKVLKCDAVLTGTVTEYQPYPNMVMGVRMKMIDLKDGQLIWAVEQVWDVSDTKTQGRIKKYLKSQVRSGQNPERQELVAMSPLKFIRFVAYEIAQTL